MQGLIHHSKKTCHLLDVAFAMECILACIICLILGLSTLHHLLSFVKRIESKGQNKALYK